LSKIPQVNVSNQGFENTVLGNFSENGYNVSFQSNGVDKVGNFSVGRGEIDGNLSGSVEENLKDGKFDEKCDIFDGNWVRDDSKPYYELGSCPFVDRDFDCHLNGRPDSDYVKWKWKPNGCDIPRYVLCMHDWLINVFFVTKLVILMFSFCYKVSNFNVVTLGKKINIRIASCVDSVWLK